ncbi:MAG TPA: cytochrome c biogenesis protein ResB [Peptococcaceae bacterium]|nr:cytochrome c biogenesis protein ResB [Peptococcaceae bacterium]
MIPLIRRWRIIFSSMRMAFRLLIVLGIAASLGTFIPQGFPADFYLEHYGYLLGKLLLMLSFDHLYSSWWFLGLEGLLGFNIVFCSLQRLRTINSIWETGSILLHLSIPVIFLGGVISAFLGIRADIKIAVGETKDLTGLGFPGYVMQLEDFRIEYYDTQEPKQYVSTVVLENASGERLAGEIKVNHPLKHKELKIYQHSYGWQVSGMVKYEDLSQPFQMEEGGELALNAQEGLVLKLIFIPDFDKQTAALRSLSSFPHNPRLACALIQDTELLDMKFAAPGEQVILGEHQVLFVAYRYYSGLIVKSDPGLLWIFCGFGLMVLGFLLRYAVPQCLMGGRKLWK